MKRVLVTHAGSRLGIGVCRNLMDSVQPPYVVAVDGDPFEVIHAAAAERHLVPSPSEEMYLPVLKSIAVETGCELVWPCGDAEIAEISRSRQRLGCGVFLPPDETVALCHDRLRLYERLSSRGVAAPRSLPVGSSDDLRAAFQLLGTEIRVQQVRGSPGGRVLRARDFNRSSTWFDAYGGRGRFVATELLAGERMGWESVWNRGRLYFSQGRRIIEGGLSALTLSGVAGIASVVVWTSDPLLEQVGISAVRAVCEEPHGIFSVDVMYGDDGQPRVTAIDAGRFAGGGAVHTRSSGISLPHLVLQLALGERPYFEAALRNPMPDDMLLIHGLDGEVVEAPLEDTGIYKHELERRFTSPARPARGGVSGRRTATNGAPPVSRS